MTASKTRKNKSYSKYLGVPSEGTTSFVPECVGVLIDLLSPEEQGLEEITEVNLGGDQTVEVPTGWKAIVVTDEGTEVAWRWPGHRVGDKSELGLNVITKEKFLDDVFENRCHFWRDDSRRAHVDIID